MKKVTIEPGCISCGSCEFTCPAVFEVKDRSYVKQDVPLAEHADGIRLAAQRCPVQVITYEE